MYTLLSAVKDTEVERARAKLPIYLLFMADIRILEFRSRLDLRCVATEAPGHSLCKTHLFGVAQFNAELAG
jgi:hypothetical protein